MNAWSVFWRQFISGFYGQKAPSTWASIVSTSATCILSAYLSGSMKIGLVVTAGSAWAGLATYIAVLVVVEWNRIQKG